MNTFLKDLQTSLVSKRPELAAQTAVQITALRHLKPDSLEALVRIVEEDVFPAKTRAAACWLLAQAHYGRASAALWKVFSGKDRDLLWESAKALAVLKTRSVVPKLISSLKSKSIEHRSAAAYTLGMMREARAITYLEAMLADKHESSTVRGHAAEALAYLKKRRSFAVLLSALKDPQAEVRWWAAFALGELGDKRALPELKRVALVDKGKARNGFSVRVEARRAYDRLSKHG
jgi:HEAT repeat protein